MLHMCVCGVHRGQERMLDALESELQIQWTMWMLGTCAHNHRANSVLTMNIVQGFALTAATIVCPPESSHNGSTESIPTEE